MKVELFHAIADPPSARVRLYIAARGLLPSMRYRNVFYPEVVADLVAHGGTDKSTPAMWDGERLYVGADAVIAALEARFPPAG